MESNVALRKGKIFFFPHHDTIFQWWGGERNNGEVSKESNSRDSTKRKGKLRVMILRRKDVESQKDVLAQNNDRIEELINGFKDGKERVKWGGGILIREGHRRE